MAGRGYGRYRSDDSKAVTQSVDGHHLEVRINTAWVFLTQHRNSHPELILAQGPVSPGVIPNRGGKQVVKRHSYIKGEKRIQGLPGTLKNCCVVAFLVQ